jgi:hypothetical protein
MVQLADGGYGARPYGYKHKRGYMKVFPPEEGMFVSELAWIFKIPMPGLIAFNFKSLDPEFDDIGEALETLTDQGGFGGWTRQENPDTGEMEAEGSLISGAWIWVYGDLKARALMYNISHEKPQFYREPEPGEEASPGAPRGSAVRPWRDSTRAWGPDVGRTRIAARSQPKGVEAVNTVDEGIIAGDILLSHHEGDAFISQITVSWPTHAGIAVSDRTVVDADNRLATGGVHGVSERPENVQPIRSKVVDKLLIDEFFYQGHPPGYRLVRTPSGGLVYRYVSGQGEENDQEAREAAAEWAESQCGKPYKFSLEGSPIVGEQRFKKGDRLRRGQKLGQVKSVDRTAIQPKEFDAETGSAIDGGEEPEPHKFFKGEEQVQSDFHAIYCAELVWRAYHFGAGVDLVDPKEFEELYKHSNRAVAAVLWWRISDERRKADYARRSWEMGDPEDIEIGEEPAQVLAKSATADKIRRNFASRAGRWTQKGKKLGPALARDRLLAHFKTENSGILCAPYQLGKSKVTERVAVLPALTGFARVQTPNFRHTDLHPMEVIDALDGGPRVRDAKSFREAWSRFVEERGETEDLRLSYPWLGYPRGGGRPAGLVLQLLPPTGDRVDMRSLGPCPWCPRGEARVHPDDWDFASRHPPPNATRQQLATTASSSAAPRTRRRRAQQARRDAGLGTPGGGDFGGEAMWKVYAPGGDGREERVAPPEGMTWVDIAAAPEVKVTAEELAHLNFLTRELERANGYVVDFGLGDEDEEDGIVRFDGEGTIWMPPGVESITWADEAARSSPRPSEAAPVTAEEPAPEPRPHNRRARWNGLERRAPVRQAGAPTFGGSRRRAAQRQDEAPRRGAQQGRGVRKPLPQKPPRPRPPGEPQEAARPRATRSRTPRPRPQEEAPPAPATRSRTPRPQRAPQGEAPAPPATRTRNPQRPQPQGEAPQPGTRKPLPTPPERK